MFESLKIWVNGMEINYGSRLRNKGVPCPWGSLESPLNMLSLCRIQHLRLHQIERPQALNDELQNRYEAATTDGRPLTRWKVGRMFSAYRGGLPSLKRSQQVCT